MNNDNEYELVPYMGAEMPMLHISAKTLLPDSDPNLSEPKWHEAMEIKYIVSGSAEITCGPRVFIASGGDTVIINPCERHAIRVLDNEKVTYNLLMVDPQMNIGGDAGRMLDPINAGSLRFNNLILAESESGRKLGRLFGEVIDEMNKKSYGYELCVTGLMAQFFAVLIRNETAPNTPPAEPDEIRRYAERLEGAFECISRRYSEDITLDELASICGMSPCYFCRVFKAVTGCSPIAYLSEYRISKAEILLRSSDTSMADIAAAVGFSDTCYFSRSFKRIRGMSPKYYRDRCRADPGQNNPSE